MTDRQQRIVWITGASSGIGKALALRLADRGDLVAVSARSRDQLDELAHRARARVGSIHAFPLDVTDREQAAATVDAIEREVGPIDVSVLAAGTHQPVHAKQFAASELAKLVEINVIGVANCLEPLIRTMTARERGRIAVVSSVAGYRGLPTAAYYGATKAALINMTEALRFDLEGQGVKLQLINPGFVKTPLTDKNEFRMPFLISADEAARRMVQGLESDAFEITFPKRFTYALKLMRTLPYRLYFPLMARATGRRD